MDGSRRVLFANVRPKRPPRSLREKVWRDKSQASRTKTVAPAVSRRACAICPDRRIFLMHFTPDAAWPSSSCRLLSFSFGYVRVLAKYDQLADLQRSGGGSRISPQGQKRSRVS